MQLVRAARNFTQKESIPGPTALTRTIWGLAVVHQYGGGIGKCDRADRTPHQEMGHDRGSKGWSELNERADFTIGTES